MERVILFCRRAGEKLGRCPRCMRISAACTLGSWLLVAVIGALWPVPAAMLAGMVLAIVFTLLTAAHLVAFGRHMAAALLSTPLRKADGTIAEPLVWSRREMAAAIGKLAAAAILGPVLWPKRAYAQQRQCDGTHPVTTKFDLIVCINSKNKDKEKQAENETQGNAKNMAMKFADDECEKINQCRKKCVRKGAGYTLKLVQCVANPAGDADCHKNHDSWKCTWEVSDISCRCT
jgi:hypothetical protein